MTRLNIALEGRYYAMAMATLGRYLIGATVVATVVTASPWPAAAQIQLDVMTFNIRTSNITDGDNAWPYRKELVAETIRRLAPQVVGMQEAMRRPDRISGVGAAGVSLAGHGSPAQRGAGAQ